MQLFAPNRSYLSYVFLQIGKIKVIAKGGLKILWIYCQNSALIMTNWIKKVRLGVDIFYKRILDSYKFISNSASEYDSSTAKFSSQPAKYKQKINDFLENILIQKMKQSRNYLISFCLENV